MSFHLDTNIVAHLMREPTGFVARRLEERAVSRSVSISVIVAAEIRFGIEKSGSSRHREAFERLLAFLPVEAWSPPADTHYGRIRADLERVGRPIGANDYLVAAHALALGATLVTDNTGEFERVPGLAIENWLPPRSSA
ncbi:type II toxin-antitoxin system VapC family toxin [Aurantimonas sp. Leaf443]|uniref:type II toxin-antitoxin system VapC family toxin n=1 Tax=Aurantimonas sp. Leaf443 TaxID=1736378 RepID=UPI0006FF44C8|nr:type II toxin-antitoxin system VapC family toxin [Aurantimonas sp. Leaf443]KQT85807.1 transcriptional regulator [Aurantimonas sp. Leaf443]